MAPAFGSGLYHTATTLPVLNGRLKTRRLLFYSLLYLLHSFVLGKRLVFTDEDNGILKTQGPGKLFLHLAYLFLYLLAVVC